MIFHPMGGEPMDLQTEGVQTRSKAVRTILEWIEEVVLAIVLIAVVFTFVCRVVTVTGTSMVPSFHDGDRVLVVSDLNGVEQGDVVVIVNVLEEPIIKRVIATEGQVVDFDYETKSVLVDGQVVDETQFGLENGITEEPFSSFELLEFPQTVPEGCVFVLGDNRAVSEDSRYQDVGMIDERNILGKAVFHLFPFQNLGPV
jgi:signal peptidase I